MAESEAKFELLLLRWMESIAEGQARTERAIDRLNETLASLLRADAAPAVPHEAAPRAPRPPGLQLPDPDPQTGKPTITWVIGPPENVGWAYGNNARRLAAVIPGFAHTIGVDDADIAVYFDVILAERYPVNARHSVVRVGGPRPLERLYGLDPERMRRGLARFDAVVVLNLQLYRLLAPLHRRVLFIPNALKLDEWSPASRARSLPAEFTVGFAASATTKAEAEVKGGHIAEAAAKQAGVKLLRLQRGDGTQIPHERMAEEFYGRCHAIVHPVAPGREGTSNVLMEALSCGVPVITTKDAGLHGEALVDGRNSIIRERSVAEFAAAIESLKNDRKLRDRLGAAAREFAERNHDLTQAGHAYTELLAKLRPQGQPSGLPRVSFVPFWTPAEKFASSRLRALYPAEILRAEGWPHVSMSYDATSDIVLVVQCCDHSLMHALRENPRQFLIYDVCDRYFENPRLFKRPEGEINSLDRFRELMERADLVTVPTRELKVEIATRYPGKPVVYVPETIDYDEEWHPVTPLTNEHVLWFGNPDRGNFESSRWLIERLRDRHGYTPLIVSRASYFKRHPELLPHVVDWSPEAMNEAFKRAGICVVSHAEEERTKSPNRLITAVMHGVPTLASGSPSCAEVLREAGMGFAVITKPIELDRAVLKIKDIKRRTSFVRKLQQSIAQRYSRRAIGAVYSNLLTERTYRPGSRETLNVGFISHNLVLGEGAPWSLMELAAGLNGQKGIRSFAYAAPGGPLKAAYAEAGVPLTIFDEKINHVAKGLNRRFGEVRRHFREWLTTNKIEVLVCNTAKSAAFARFGAEMGLGSVVIIRESFAPKERFKDFEGEGLVATEIGISQAEQIVFVADTSRQAWADHKFFGKVHVIPNGVDPARFKGSIDRPRAELRAALGLVQDEVIAVCVGTVNLRKGQEGLMRAFAALAPEVRAKSRIIFLGALENSYLPTFEAMLAELPEEIRSRMTLVRATPQVGQYLRASDFLLMNSTSEAYPRSVVEGLLFGLPILSTGVFGVKEQVVHGQTGFLYEFDDMASWSAHFTSLVEDAALRERMAIDAARSFWKLTTHSEMLHIYRSVVQNLADHRRRLRDN